MPSATHTPSILVTAKQKLSSVHRLIEDSLGISLSMSGFYGTRIGHPRSGYGHLTPLDYAGFDLAAIENQGANNTCFFSTGPAEHSVLE